MRNAAGLRKDSAIAAHRPNDCKAEVMLTAAGRSSFQSDLPDQKRQTQKRRPRTNTSPRPPLLFGTRSSAGSARPRRWPDSGSMMADVISIESPVCYNGVGLTLKELKHSKLSCTVCDMDWHKDLDIIRRLVIVRKPESFHHSNRGRAMTV